MNAPDLILHNGNITTLDPLHPQVSAVAVAGGRITATGGDELLTSATETTQRIDLKGRRVIPGLNDSHIHVIRGGLNFNMELRWDGVPSLALALEMLREQARRTPPPQWVRVIGGWTEFQFAEHRMPTLEEINAVSPDTPVFVLHLYDRAFINRAALRALGYTKETPDPAGGEIQRDKAGNPTGLLIAKPNALILYASLAKGPKLDFDDQVNSTRHFMRELNRLGITSCIDAGGGFQNYPDDYRVVEELAGRDELTLRIAYNLFTQRPKEEYDDFAGWAKIVSPGQGSDVYRMNGAGEMLVFSAADFEDFLEPRPDLQPVMEAELKKVIGLLVEKRWPFRLHATYDESISRFRPCRDHFGTQHGAAAPPGGRHRHPGPHGLPGGILCGPLRRRGGPAVAARGPHVEPGHTGRRRYRRHAGIKLQSLGVALLAGERQNSRRSPPVRRKESPQ
jgi:predicted amidohydrolase YtcJ